MVEQECPTGKRQQQHCHTHSNSQHVTSDHSIHFVHLAMILHGVAHGTMLVENLALTEEQGTSRFCSETESLRLALQEGSRPSCRSIGTSPNNQENSGPSSEWMSCVPASDAFHSNKTESQELSGICFGSDTSVSLGAVGFKATEHCSALQFLQLSIGFPSANCTQ